MKLLTYYRNPSNVFQWIKKKIYGEYPFLFRVLRKINYNELTTFAGQNNLLVAQINHVKLRER
jgi:hypothetical protein